MFMSMRQKVKSVADLESRTWYRLFKVVFLLSYLIIALIGTARFASHFAYQYHSEKLPADMMTALQDIRFHNLSERKQLDILYAIDKKDNIQWDQPLTDKELRQNISTHRDTAKELNVEYFYEPYYSWDSKTAIIVIVVSILFFFLLFMIIRMMVFYVLLGTSKPPKTTPIDTDDNA